MKMNAGRRVDPLRPARSGALMDVMSRLRSKPVAVAVLVVVGVAGLAAATLSGGADALPSDGVAKVGDTVIRRSQFDAWLLATAQGQGREQSPDPPRFVRCVAEKRKQSRTEGAAPRAGELRRQCRQEYAQLRDGVLRYLIEAEWIRQEAGARGIEVSEGEARRSFEDKKERAFPTESAYRKFLGRSGMREEDIVLRVQLELLEQKLIQQATEDRSKAPVSQSDVKEYFAENRARFGRGKQSFARAEESVRAAMRAERRQKALGAFTTEFSREYRRKTTCADGFRIAACSNES